MWPFKKREKENIVEKHKKLDFSKYNLELNFKSMCYFEKLTGKSFFETEIEDIGYLLYASFIINNPTVKMTYEAFTFLMEDERVTGWLLSKYKDIMGMVEQMSKNVEAKEDNVEAKKDKAEESHLKTITDIATSLIIDYKMDAHYVMYEMEIWEIEPFFEAIDNMVKTGYERERLFTYITVMPHIDGKKVKGPQDLMPFEWEKAERKAKAEKEMKNNMYAIKNMIGKSIFGD